MITYPEIFKNIEQWKKLKNITLFKNEIELQTYQNYYLKKLIKNKKKYENFTLVSSGTTSNISKKYSFPKELYWIIDNHHMWRIFESHNIKPGNSIKIFQAERSAKKKFTGPKIDVSMGIENNTWTLLFKPIWSDNNFWKKIFDQIKMIKPNFLYTSPSVFDSFYSFLLEENLKFNFPVIFSCETLTDSTRNKSNIFFSKSIDKMKDWTTGFGFYECSLGTKHIYDDLCICEQKEKNKICSTDLFNYNENFINVMSDDLGMIKKLQCDCGIYGNTLSEFQGKIYECLVSVQGKKYAANYISNVLNFYYNFDMLNYEIIQDKNKNIIFKTRNELKDEQTIELAKYFKYIILDDGGELNLYKDDKTFWYSKKSNISINFKKEEFKIYTNKKISVRSFAI